MAGDTMSGTRGMWGPKEWGGEVMRRLSDTLTPVPDIVAAVIQEALAARRVRVLDLLRRIKEQGLAHQCAMEGFIPKYGCHDCDAATEKALDDVIASLEAEGDPKGP